jgi:hypothetical protein
VHRRRYLWRAQAMAKGVEGPSPLSLPVMAAHYQSVPARWSHRMERHPAWDLVSRCDFILVGSAVLLSLLGAVMVYSATRVELAAAGVDPKFYRNASSSGSRSAW